MNADPFASSLISQILTWIFCTLLLLVGVTSMIAEFPYDETDQGERVPLLFMIWLFLCVLFFSPIRYILLQIFMAIAFPFQGIWSFLSAILLAFYIPIVFIILFGIALGIPGILIALIAGWKEPCSRRRLFLAAISAPIILFVFSIIYFKVLPLATYSTHWVGTDKIIRTTNGPTYYFYRFLVRPLTSLQLPDFAYDIGPGNMAPKEHFRAHVVGLYCGKKQLWYYVSTVYPDYYLELRSKASKLTIDQEKAELEHFWQAHKHYLDAMRYLAKMTEGDYLVGTFTEKERDTLLAKFSNTLKHAELISEEVLKKIHPQLPKAYHLIFIPCMQNLTKAWSDGDPYASIEGDVLDGIWRDWYNSNRKQFYLYKDEDFVGKILKRLGLFELMGNPSTDKINEPSKNIKELAYSLYSCAYYILYLHPIFWKVESEHTEITIYLEI